MTFLMVVNELVFWLVISCHKAEMGSQHQTNSFFLMQEI